MTAPAAPHTFSTPQDGRTETEYVVMVRQPLGTGDWFRANHRAAAATRESAEASLAAEIEVTAAEVAKYEALLASIPAHDTDEIAFTTKQLDQIRSTEHAIFTRTITAFVPV